jgi:outer membrane protein TolC
MSMTVCRFDFVLCAVLARVLAAAPLAAQAPLTLQDAIRLAQENGRDARAARDAHDAARYRDQAFWRRLLPQLSMGGTLPQYNRSIIPVLQPDGTTLFRPQQQTSATMSLNLSQTLPLTGGSLYLTSSLQRLDLSGAQSSRTWSSAPFAVGVRQDIFRPNAANWDRRVQSAQIESDERAYLAAREQVAAQVADRFFAAYAARTGLANAEANATVNDTLYRINTGRLQVGKIGENDLLQSQLALLRARAALEAARLEHERALASLRLALGLPPDQPIVIAVTTDVPDFEPDTAVAVAQALRNSAALSQTALADVEASRRVTEAQLSDGIGATVQASYGFNATAPDMRTAYQNLLESRTLQVSVQMPLWQWGAHGSAVNAAKADRDRTTEQSRSALEQLAMQAKFAALSLTQARRNLEVQAVADSVAGKRFEVAYNRYVIGRITVDNLYIAQNEKDQALLDFVNALRGYWIAYYQLRGITLYDFVAGRPIR